MSDDIKGNNEFKGEFNRLSTKGPIDRIEEMLRNIQSELFLLKQEVQKLTTQSESTKSRQVGKIMKRHE
jgi:cob(I)alamin adenosyltransferase